MVSITVRNLNGDAKSRLQARAAASDHSMEEDARPIPRDALRRQTASEQDLSTAIHESFKSFGIVELKLPPQGEIYSGNRSRQWR